jgi:5-methylcytosine-specific restriction endonuclease McrA
MCLEDGLPEEEAKIAWSDYEADHIVPHAKGGQTNLDNAQLLCSTHNKQKGADIR